MFHDLIHCCGDNGVFEDKFIPRALHQSNRYASNGQLWSFLGLVWFGLVWFGLVWFGLVWFGLLLLPLFLLLLPLFLLFLPTLLWLLLLSLLLLLLAAASCLLPLDSVLHAVQTFCIAPCCFYSHEGIVVEGMLAGFFTETWHVKSR